MFTDILILDPNAVGILVAHQLGTYRPRLSCLYKAVFSHTDFPLLQVPHPRPPLSRECRDNHCAHPNQITCLPSLIACLAHASCCRASLLMPALPSLICLALFPLGGHGAKAAPSCRTGLVLSSRGADNKHIRFWEDVWCGVEPLCVTFTNIYTVAITQREA